MTADMTADMTDGGATHGKKEDIPALMAELGTAAHAAARLLAVTPAETKNKALTAAAAALRATAGKILAANAADMDEAAEVKGLSKAHLERLMLNEDRIEDMARGLEDIAALDDPVGKVMAAWDRPNGLHIERIRTPLGVIGVIFESRPNVTADAGALCLKAGNAVILRGGSESFHSCRAIMRCLARGLAEAGLPEAAIQLVPTTDRDAVGEMLTMTGTIDVIVPRGGKSLIERVSAESKVPLFKHLEGICHTYIDAAADPEKARAIVVNAKMRRTGICGATETLLVDEAVDDDLILEIISDLIHAGCEIRGDKNIQSLDVRVLAAKEDDWDTEYLDAIISAARVKGVEGAIEHIAGHSSNHTEAIITEDSGVAEKFLSEVDSAIVMVNTSTQFADGGEFGMGAEIGVSTGKMHARGPVGVEQLTSFKYVVRGNGQCRP